MTEKRIWIVTELFYPEETAVAFIFTRIANYLSNNYNVCIICGPEFYDKAKKKFVDKILISDKIKIYRIRSISFDKNSLLQRSLKMFILSIQMLFLMCRRIPKGETVLLSTNPATLLLSVSFIKKIKKNKIHILVHDVFPENAIPAKIFKNSNAIIYRVIKYFFDRAYSSADHLIVIGKDMKEVMEQKILNSLQKPTISIVPNWSNPENYTLSMNSAKRKSELVLQYAGNLGRVQGLKEILEAFMVSGNRDLILNFHGTGALYSYIGNYINKNSLSNVYLKGGFSRNEEAKILELCDIGIVSLSEGMYGMGVPSKAYHLLSAGKPILYIGEPNTEIFDMVNKNKIGWTVDIRRHSDIIDFFNKISSIEVDTLRMMGENARKLAENEYNEMTVLKSLQSKIEIVD